MGEFWGVCGGGNLLAAKLLARDVISTGTLRRVSKALDRTSGTESDCLSVESGDLLCESANKLATFPQAFLNRHLQKVRSRASFSSEGHPVFADVVFLVFPSILSFLTSTSYATSDQSI